MGAARTLMSQTWVFVDPETDPLLLFLFQLALTLVLTRILGKLLASLKQPQVIGEIIAGVLMGPSVLGRIPGFTDKVFPTATHLDANTTYDSTTTFSVIANTGLILFMFLMGAELDRSLLRKQWKRSFPIAISAIAFPFGIGCAIALWIQNINKEGQPENWQAPSLTAFVLFAGASMSFTAFPVLASILSANAIMQTPLGVLAMSTAAINDVVAWSVLAIASSFAKSGTPVNGVYTCILAVLYVLLMLILLRPALLFLHMQLEKRNLQNNRYYFCLLMLLLIASAYCTEAIGIHSFFGAFLMGLIIPQGNGFAEILVPRMELVVTEVFLPLYFAYSGIKTDIGTLDSARYWGITLALILVACVAKVVPTLLVAKLVSGRSWRSCTTLGCLMNTRGLVEIIGLNIGLSLGILSTRLFTMLVLMAILTTMLTSPTVWALYIRKYPDGLDEQDQAEKSGLESSDVEIVVSERPAAVGAAEDKKPFDKLDGETASPSTSCSCV